MTLYIDKFVTSYYCEKMEIDISDISDCKNKTQCYQDYKKLYINTWDNPANQPTKDNPKGLNQPVQREEQTLKILFDKLFENTYSKLIKKYKKDDKNPLILFPVMENDSSGDTYFNSLDFKVDNIKENFAFIPIFSENETKEEFTEKIDNAINDIKERISKNYNNEEEVKKRGGKVNEKERSYTNLVIILNNDKDNSFFTSMYKKELKKDKKDILNSKIKELMNRSSIDRQPVKSNSLKQESIKSITLSYFKAEYKKITGKSINDKDYEQRIIEFISKLNESYKRVIDKKYLALVTSDDQASFLRIFYRVNLDKDINYNEIKPGNEFLYRLNNIGIQVFNKKLSDITSKKNEKYTGYVGLLNKIPGYKTRYTFQLHNKITSEFYKNDGQHDIENEIEITEDKDDEEEEDSQEKYVKIQLELKYKNGYIEAETVGKNKQKGIIEFYKDLHIYEKYRWFKFNDLDGSLPSETKITIYEDTLFDKKSLINFLTSKGTYNTNTRLAVEFLKINVDKNLLLEYTSYIYSNLNKSNIYKKSMFGLSEESFKEKCKKEIMNILFQTNELIYFGGGVRAKETKTDIRKNYKIISYNYIPIDNLDNNDGLKIDIKNEKDIKKYYKLVGHFRNKMYSKSNEEEFRYCQKHKIDNCEFFREKIQPNENRAIIIVDVTKDNIDAKNLKKVTECKRLKQTIKREARDIFSSIKIYNPIKVFPYTGGRTRKKYKKLYSRRKRRIQNV